MADITDYVNIDGLPPADNIFGAEMMEVLQAGVNRRATTEQVVKPLKDSLANPDQGAKLLAFKSNLNGTKERTQADENSDTVNIRWWTGDSKVNGVDDLQVEIQTAVTEAINAGYTKMEWPPGTYVSSGNISGFHQLSHSGKGVIKRGDDIWFITPARNTHINRLYIGSGAAGANDGLSPQQPTTPQTALFNAWEMCSDKALRGSWEIIFGEGVFRYNGVVVSNAPTFKNPLKIIGQRDSITGLSLSTWKYPGSSNKTAYKDESGAANKNVIFDGIRFEDWPMHSISILGQGNVSIPYAEVDNCGSEGSFAIWIRNARVVFQKGKISNCPTGVCVQYSGMYNIGASGGGIAFSDCNTGVSIGRGSKGHVSYNTFDRMASYCIHADQNSRIRTIKNDFNSFGIAGINLGGGAVWDNDANERDTWAGLTAGKQMVQVLTGGLARPLNSSGRTKHQLANTNYSLPAGIGRKSISYSEGYTAAFVLLGGSLFSESLIGEATYYVALQNLQGAKFELASGQNGENSIVSVTSPLNNSGSSKRAKVTFKIFGPQAGSNIGRVYAELIMDGEAPQISENTVNYNNENFRSPDAVTRNLTLYVTPTDTARAGPTMTHFVSYLEP